jgi:hypothetical protein
MQKKPDPEHFEQIIHRIVKGLSATTGEMFFRTLVKQLGTVLQVDMVMIGQVIPEITKLKTLAMYNAGKVEENIDYDLPDTPCGQVASGQLCNYPSGVRKLFPRSSLLEKMGIEAYIGTPLYSTAGEVLGILAFMFQKTVEHPAFMESMLTLFASRTAAELERTRKVDLVIRNESRLAALLDLSLKSGEMSEEEIIHTGIEEAVRLTDSSIGYFHLVSKDEREIRC